MTEIPTEGTAPIEPSETGDLVVSRFWWKFPGGVLRGRVAFLVEIPWRRSPGM